MSVIHESLVQWELEKTKMESASKNANAALVAALMSVVGTLTTVLVVVFHISG